jgi:retinoblastoma-like protein 2
VIWSINLNSSLWESTFVHFFFCSKAISKAYEEYVLSVGNLDERIFLGEDAEEEIGTLSRCLYTGSGTESAERVQMKNILQQHFDKVSWANSRWVEIQE